MRDENILYKEMLESCAMSDGYLDKNGEWVETYTHTEKFRVNKELREVFEKIETNHLKNRRK